MKNTESKFENFGYFKEYYINGKFIGTLVCEKDRETLGYYGKSKEIIQDKIKLDNNKVLKQGTETETMLFPLCGKIKL